MTTTQNSSQVKPEVIGGLGVYTLTPTWGNGNPSYRSETIYICYAGPGKRAQYFTKLEDAIVAKYEDTVIERTLYKRSCPGRDNADRTIKSMMFWLLDNEDKSILESISPTLREINKRRGFSVC